MALLDGEGVRVLGVPEPVMGGQVVGRAPVVVVVLPAQHRVLLLHLQQPLPIAALPEVQDARPSCNFASSFAQTMAFKCSPALRARLPMARMSRQLCPE